MLTPTGLGKGRHRTSSTERKGLQTSQNPLEPPSVCARAQGRRSESTFTRMERLRAAKHDLGAPELRADGLHRENSLIRQALRRTAFPAWGQCASNHPARIYLPAGSKSRQEQNHAWPNFAAGNRLRIGPGSRDRAREHEPARTPPACFLSFRRYHARHASATFCPPSSLLYCLQMLQHATSSPYLTVPEAAKFLRVSPWSVRRLIDAGSLPAAKAGTASNSKILISRDDLEKFLWAAP
jgi:excisionase family DNA binding protein